MSDFERIKSNVELMAGKGAPVSDIDGYLATEGYTPEKFKNAQAPSLGSTFLNAIPKGFSAAADSVLNLGPNVLNLSKMAVGTAATAMGRPDLAPDVSEPRQFTREGLTGLGVIRPSAEPQNTAGRIVDMTGQALGGGGVNPASVVRNLGRGAILPVVRDVAAAAASGAGAGAGMELAGNVDTGSESGNTALRTAAALIGGSAPGMAIASRGTGGDRAAAALKGVTPQQLALARELAKKAADAGSPITGYEAIQAVTGTNPKMQTQQRVAEQSDAAAANLTPMMQNRPAKNAALFENSVGQVAPPEPRPDALAGTLRETAETAIKAARNEGNVKAAPYYAASSNNPSVKIPPSDWNSIVSDPAMAAALKAVKADPFNKLQNATEGSVQWLDAAKKWLDSQASSKGQAGDNFAAATRSDAARGIVNAVDPVVPAYAKARSIVADNMEQNVKPLENGQVGKLSRSDDFNQQAAALLPEKPMDVNPAVIDRTAQTLGAQNPDVVRRFLAQYLRGTFNEANGGGVGNNPMGGYNFAKKVADNPMQRDNLVQALQSSKTSPIPITDALDVFQAQGFKPAVNSATSSNMAESSLMGGAKAADMLMRPFKAIPGAVDSYRNGWATKALAEALSSGGDSVKRLEELARVNGAHSPVKQQLLINLLLANPSNQATQ